MLREKNLKILSNPLQKINFLVSAVHLTITRSHWIFINILISALPSRFHAVSQKAPAQNEPIHGVPRNTPFLNNPRNATRVLS